MSLEATINVNSLPDQELEKILEAVTEYENSLEADQPLNSDNLGKNLNILSLQYLNYRGK